MPTLVNTKRAAAMWLDRLDTDLELNKDFLWDTIEQECSNTASQDLTARFGGVSNIAVDAEYIGTDADNCVAYFSLSGIQVLYHVEQTIPVCDLAGFFPPSTSAAFHFLGNSTEALDIGNGAAEAGPSGASPTGVSGIPVVAAVHIGGDNWAPLAVGTVAAADLASAIAACGMSGVNMCGAGVENVNIHIRIAEDLLEGGPW